MIAAGADEENIRIDLIVIHLILAILSVWALLRMLR